MHFTMFEITPYQRTPDDFLIEEDLMESDFIGQIADYVNNVLPERRTQLITEFLDMFPAETYTYDDQHEAVVFAPEVKEFYFRDRYQIFKKKARGLRFEDYISGYNGEVFSLRMLLEERYDDYVYEDGQIMPMDNFIRGLIPGNTYYFGGVLDFHV